MALFARANDGGAYAVSPSVSKSLAAIDAAMREGDKKYGVNAWATRDAKPSVVEDHLGAMCRHLGRHMSGDTVDESGESALAHVAARAVMALEMHLRHKEKGT